MRKPARLPSPRSPAGGGDPGGALIDAIERGLELARADPDDVTMLVHGTTLVTNAVLENKLPRASLLTTGGFRDILEIGRHFRPDMYDLQQDKPEPIIPRDRRFGIAERMTAAGDVITAPDRKDIASVVDAIRVSKSEAVAVCFLNAYINPANEATVRDWIADALPTFSVSASHEVCREVREFERMSTVALNAAAMPLVSEISRGNHAARSRHHSERENPSDAVERRLADGRCGARLSGPDDHVRTGGRRVGGAASRQGDRIIRICLVSTWAAPVRTSP